MIYCFLYIFSKIQAYTFWTSNCYNTRIGWKIKSLIRRRNCDILRYAFRIAIGYKSFVYCDISIYCDTPSACPTVTSTTFIYLTMRTMETKAFYSYFSSYSHANYTWIYLDIPRYKYIVEICLRTTDVIINLIYMCLHTRCRFAWGTRYVRLTCAIRTS